VNALDRVIGYVAPGWAARREEARLEAEACRVRQDLVRRFGAEGTYLDAARRDRTSADWPSTATSADGGLIADLSTINARARAAVWNDWAGRSTVGTYRRHVVGIGITARSAARDPQTGEESETFRRWNQRIDRLHEHWAHRPWLCDVEKTKSLAEIDGLAVSDFATVGEAFCVHTFSPRRGQVGMAIQMFEAEQLDATLTRNSDNGNSIRGGIEIDGQGVAVAFWIHTGTHPLDSWTGPRGSTRVPADRVYHLIRQERVRQTHGLSQLAAVLEDIYQLKGYKLAEAVGKRLEACIGLRKRTEQWYTPEGSPVPFAGLGTTPPAGGGTQDGRGNPKIRWEPGMIVDAGHGQYYETLNPQRPGAQYDTYVKRQGDQIASGAGIDGAHLTRNFNDGTYTSQRQGSLELDREMDPIQQNLVIDQWCRPRREAFKLYAVLQGLAKAPGMFESDELMMAYLEEDWAGPPKPWVDPRNQAQATQIALQNGLTDLRHEKNILGGDWRDAIRQRRAEADLCEEEDVKLPWLSGTSAAQGGPANLIGIGGIQKPGVDDADDADDVDDVDGGDEQDGDRRDQNEPRASQRGAASQSRGRELEESGARRG